MRKGTILASLLGLALATALLSKSPTEEERIEQALAQVRDGIEQENLPQVMSIFSKEYADAEGSSYDSIKGTLLRQFLKAEPITIQMSPLRFSMKAESAQVAFEAAILEGQNASLFAIPSEEDVLHFTVDLRKEEDDWRIVSHQRQLNVTVREQAD